MKLETPIHAGAGLVAPPARDSRRLGSGLTAAYASEVGSSHAQNEDCCSHVPSGDAPHFCGVADGVGGGAHGEIASSALLQFCADAPREIYRDPVKLGIWLTQADAEVRAAIARRSQRPGAATLAAVWFVSSSAAMVANVGDCRVYRLRPKDARCAIEQLTVDQTYATLLQQPPANGSANDPARMVGAGALGVPPIIRVRIRNHDLLLLCSDGVHKFVNDRQITLIVNGGLSEGRSLKRICASLVEAARSNGSQDDASALLVLRWPGLLSRALLPLVLVVALLAAAASQDRSPAEWAAALQPQAILEGAQTLLSGIWNGAAK